MTQVSPASAFHQSIYRQPQASRHVVLDGCRRLRSPDDGSLRTVDCRHFGECAAEIDQEEGGGHISVRTLDPHSSGARQANIVDGKVNQQATLRHARIPPR
jgi:hypothetical protein